MFSLSDTKHNRQGPNMLMLFTRLCSAKCINCKYVSSACCVCGITKKCVANRDDAECPINQQIADIG